MLSFQRFFSNHIWGIGFGLSLVALLISTPSLVWGEPISSATYRAVFEGIWTAENHPTGFPSNSHFSPIIGAAHNADTSFWMPGEMASPGLERVAEIGMPDTLRVEVEEQIGMGNALAVIMPALPTGNTGTVTVEFEFSVNTDFPLVTLATMIGPSPDWFVGVSGLSLLDARGQWELGFQLDLFPYDAGTEDGTMFSTANPDSMPTGSIMSVKGVTPFSDQPMATLTVKLMNWQDFHVSLEQPLEGPVAGVGLVRGWAFADHPWSLHITGNSAQPDSADVLSSGTMNSAPVTIELLIDGVEVSEISSGSERGDVAAAFPDAEGALKSGFGLTTNYGLFEPGPHGLTVRGTSNTGAQFAVTRQIVVKQFGGFEFADVMLSGAAVRLDGEILVIDGVKVSDGMRDSDATPDREQTQTISLMWSKEAQGFVITDIMDQ